MGIVGHSLHHPGCAMRGAEPGQQVLFSYVAIEARIPPDHPLRAMKALLEPVLAELAPRFATMYADGGRPSIPPEQLLRALLLQVLYTVRSDLSCTVFLNEPADYEGGSLHIRLSDGSMRFKLKPGQAIVYPSDTLHEVEPVTKGERLVAITFIQSRVKDPFQRHMLFELNEVAALEGLKMDKANFSRLQLVQANLLRYWGDQP